jgi:hypothetical protein
VLEHIRSGLTSINGSYEPGENNMQPISNSPINRERDPINTENNESFLGRVVRVGGEQISSFFSTIVKIVKWILKWIKETVLSFYHFFVPAAPPAPINFTCRDLYGTEINISLLPTDTVSALKQKIKDSEGIPMDFQRIIFCARQLTENSTLGWNGITNGSLVYLCLRLGGD